MKLASDSISEKSPLGGSKTETRENLKLM